MVSDFLFEGKFLKWVENVRKVSYREALSTIGFYSYLSVFTNAHDVDVIHLSKTRWHPYGKE